MTQSGPIRVQSTGSGPSVEQLQIRGSLVMGVAELIESGPSRVCTLSLCGCGSTRLPVLAWSLPQSRLIMPVHQDWLSCA